MDPKTQQQVEGGEPTDGPLTRADVEKLMEAQANRFKAEMRKASESRSKEFDESLKKLQEQMSTISSPKPEEPKPAADLVAAKYEAEMKKLKEQVEAERTAREQEKANRLAQEERTALAQAMSEANVVEELRPALAALLYDAQRLITRTDDGGIGMRVKRDYGDDVVSLNEGLADYLKTSSGKHYVAARPAAGSGATAGKPGKGPGGQVSREELLAQLGRSIMERQ